MPAQNFLHSFASLAAADTGETAQGTPAGVIDPTGGRASSACVKSADGAGNEVNVTYAWNGGKDLFYLREEERRWSATWWLKVDAVNHTDMYLHTEFSLTWDENLATCPEDSANHFDVQAVVTYHPGYDAGNGQIGEITLTGLMNVPDVTHYSFPFEATVTISAGEEPEWTQKFVDWTNVSLVWDYANATLTLMVDGEALCQAAIERLRTTCINDGGTGSLQLVARAGTGYTGGAGWSGPVWVDDWSLWENPPDTQLEGAVPVPAMECGIEYPDGDEPLAGTSPPYDIDQDAGHVGVDVYLADRDYGQFVHVLLEGAMPPPVFLHTFDGPDASTVSDTGHPISAYSVQPGEEGTDPQDAPAVYPTGGVGGTKCFRATNIGRIQWNVTGHGESFGNAWCLEMMVKFGEHDPEQGHRWGFTFGISWIPFLGDFSNSVGINIWWSLDFYGGQRSRIATDFNNKIDDVGPMYLQNIQADNFGEYPAWKPELLDTWTRVRFRFDKATALLVAEFGDPVVYTQTYTDPDGRLAAMDTSNFATLIDGSWPYEDQPHIWLEPGGVMATMFVDNWALYDVFDV